MFTLTLLLVTTQSILFIWCYYSVFSYDFIAKTVQIEPYQIFVQF